jgi:NADPH:quinone reductase-like Zn-dependent oxidoreductase
VIEYDGYGNRSVTGVLKERYGKSRFDVVVDAVGIQDVFDHCAEFLKEGGTYVTVGPRARSLTVLGMLETIRLMAANMLWPKILGGVPRKYAQVTAVSTDESLEKLRVMVEQGSLRVHVGCLETMENAKAVSEVLENLVATADKTNRYTTYFSLGMHGARSW